MNAQSISVFTVVCMCASAVLPATADPPTSLKLVHVIYRHGDRSPFSVFPNDRNKAEVWGPDGLNWLTNQGKQQQYQLGQYIGARYGGLINTSRYTHEELVVQSSAAPRCLQSAYATLAGLYPPHGDQVWRVDLPWQPIPVLTSPKSSDNKIAQKAPCPRYTQLVNQQLSSPAVTQHIQGNLAFYTTLSSESGVPLSPIQSLWAVGDTLLCERAHNLTMNVWFHRPGVYDRINRLRSLNDQVLYGLPEQARLMGGPLVAEMVGNMQAQGSAPTKMFMYSGHATTVTSLLANMQVMEVQEEPMMYGAMVMVELHQGSAGDVVKVFYRNDTSVEPYELSPAGCGAPCLLSTFTSLMAPRTPVVWAKECTSQLDPVVG